MKIVLLSDYLTYHITPLAKEFSKICEFTFALTKEPTEFRAPKEKNNIDFVNLYEYKKKEIVELFKNTNCILVTKCNIRYLGLLSNYKGVVFHLSERIFKGYKWDLKNIIRFCKWKILVILYGGRKNNGYLLCSSAFASRDYSILSSYNNRSLKWGYFPEIKHYDVEKLIASKSIETISILWLGRLIDWKHPESVIFIAKKFKNAGYNFKIDIVGDGPLYKSLKNAIKENYFSDCVSLLGYKEQDEVRSYMEKANIFLFTSDQNEGWGAVLNESMNSGCAVVAANQIGSVPYLIKDGENGLVFKQNDWEDLYNKCKLLIDNKELREKLSINAYKTITEEWNAKVAAERVINLAQSLMNGEDTKYTEGICSKA